MMNSSSGLLSKSAHFIFRKFLQPKLGGEDLRRREFILNVILTASIVMLFILDLMVLYYRLKLGAADNGISFWLFSSILGAFLAMYALSRFGYPRLSAYLLVAGYLGSISFGAYQFGVDLPPVLLSYALLIIIAGILVSTRFSFLITALIAAVILPLWHFEISGAIQPAWYWKNEPKFVEAVEFSILFFIFAVISWLSNRETERSLLRARRSEAELREERNLLEIKVEERTRELRQAQLERMGQLARFAEVGRLATGMIHDLLSPLTAIALNVEELPKNEAASLETREHLELAISSAKRMEHLITAIRKRMSQQELQVAFSLDQEIGQVLHLFEYKAKKAGVELSFLHREEVQIFGDPVKFNQVVSNLVSNAIDSYDNISMESKTVEISLSRHREIVRLTVEDHGAGIPQEFQDKIFDPFFTTKEINKGTGLGLATVKHIVEAAFGGTISVRSAVGKGAAFTVEFAA